MSDKPKGRDSNPALPKSKVIVKCFFCDSPIIKWRSQVLWAAKFGQTKFFCSKECRAACPIVRDALADFHLTIYTPEFLNQLMEYKGANCSFPNCNKPLSKRGPKSRWHTCARHSLLLRAALFSQNKRREETGQRLGVEVTETPKRADQPRVQLICSFCKQIFWRGHAKIEIAKARGQTEFYCSKDCKNADKKQTIAIRCSFCGEEITCYKSRLYYKSPAGEITMKRFVFCNIRCKASFGI